LFACLAPHPVSHRANARDEPTPPLQGDSKSCGHAWSYAIALAVRRRRSNAPALAAAEPEADAVDGVTTLSAARRRHLRLMLRTWLSMCGPATWMLPPRRPPENELARKHEFWAAPSASARWRIRSTSAPPALRRTARRARPGRAAGPPHRSAAAGAPAHFATAQDGVDPRDQFRAERLGDVDRRRSGARWAADDLRHQAVSPRELVARVNAIPAPLAKCAGRTRGRRADARGALLLDPDERAVLFDGAPVALTSIEFAIVRTLMARPKFVFSRELIRGRLWRQHPCRRRTSTSHVRNIRAKMAAAGQRQRC